MVQYIYLAAGVSSRFGNTNKLLAPMENRMLFTHTLENLFLIEEKNEDVSITIVTRYHMIAEYVQDKPVTVVYNPDMEVNITASIKAGIKGLPELDMNDSIIFVVADQPFLTLHTLEKFLILAREGVSLASAYHKEVPCSPTLFSAEYHAKLCSLKGDIGGRQILKTQHHIRVLVTNEESKDVDTKENLHELNTSLC